MSSTSNKPQSDLVSIIIPAYNSRGTVRRAVTSALDSIWRYIEVVVVDDGSQDGTVGALDDLRSDPRLRIVRKTNGGLGAARHWGVIHSAGQWITFLDADDEMDANRVPYMLDAAKKIGEHALFFSCTRVFKGGRRLRDIACQNHTQVVNKTVDFYHGRLRPSGAALFLSRNCYDSLGGFPVHIRRHTELDFFIRAAARSVPVWLVPLPLYRQHLSETSNRHCTADRRESLEYIFSRAEQIHNTSGGSLQKRQLDAFFDIRTFIIWSVAFEWNNPERNDIITCLTNRPWNHPLRNILYRLSLGIPDGIPVKLIRSAIFILKKLKYRLSGRI